MTTIASFQLFFAFPAFSLRIDDHSLSDDFPHRIITPIRE